MNLPNKITISRIFLIPIFMVIMLAPFDWGSYKIGDVDLPIQHLVGHLSLSLLQLQIGLMDITQENIIL